MLHMRCCGSTSLLFDRHAPLRIILRIVLVPMKPNFGLMERVNDLDVFGSEVDADSVCPRAKEEAQRHNHCNPISVTVSRYAGQRWHASTSNHTTSNVSAASLCVPTETAHAQRDDGREADRFEE